VKKIAIALLLLAPAARAQTQTLDTPYILHDYIHTFFGMGGSPNVTPPILITTFEIGRHPFRSWRSSRTFDGKPVTDRRTITFGAFSAGASLAGGWDPGGQLLYAAAGLRFAIDLTYVFLSGLWSTVDFDQCFPFHVTLGERLTIAYTDSRSIKPAYDLARVEAETALDFEVPIGRRRQHSVIVRGAIDSSVALDSTFRMLIQVGYGFSWERP
jgi:hypothetical protein